MDRIVVNLEPFDRKQSVLAFKANEIIAVVKVPLEDIPKSVQVLCNQYDISQIDLCGCAAMLCKTQEDIYALDSFENKDITVTIMER
ncbi:MAG: hypothetical protein J6T34_03545 [Bacilli bacterium]|nr:hypothetical protein [Bacilli bacterium]